MPRHDTTSIRDLEIRVLDAEVAAEAILDTPKLQPASARLVDLDEAIVAELKRLEEGGADAGPKAEKLRALHSRTLDTLRSISAEAI
jgi:hypothetical protein